MFKDVHCKERRGWFVLDVLRCWLFGSNQINWTSGSRLDFGFQEGFPFFTVLPHVSRRVMKSPSAMASRARCPTPYAERGVFCPGFLGESMLQAVGASRRLLHSSSPQNWFQKALGPKKRRRMLLQHVN